MMLGVLISEGGMYTGMSKCAMSKMYASQREASLGRLQDYTVYINACANAMWDRRCEDNGSDVRVERKHCSTMLHFT